MASRMTGRAPAIFRLDAFSMRGLALATIALTLSGCATGVSMRPGSNSQITMVKQADLPAPSRGDQYALERPYLIGPYDKLKINVFGIPDLNSDVQTDASGRISIPLVGIVEAAGKTPDEVARSIERSLRGRYVRNPNVTVNLVETVSQVVTVDGEVRSPGLYPVVGRMTLMRAVARAQGTTDLAKTTEVMVFRTVDGQQMVGLYDLRAIRLGNYSDPEIYANDVVVVSTSQARRLFRDLLPVAGLMVSPLVAILN